jgi:hypothetical protein
MARSDLLFTCKKDGQVAPRILQVFHEVPKGVPYSIKVK